MTPEQLKIMALTMVVEKLKYHNLKPPKYFKTTPNKKKGKVSQAQSGNSYGKYNNNGKKDR